MERYYENANGRLEKLRKFHTQCIVVRENTEALTEAKYTKVQMKLWVKSPRIKATGLGTDQRSC